MAWHGAGRRIFDLNRLPFAVGLVALMGAVSGVILLVGGHGTMTAALMTTFMLALGAFLIVLYYGLRTMDRLAMANPSERQA